MWQDQCSNLYLQQGADAPDADPFSGNDVEAQSDEAAQ